MLALTGVAGDRDRGKITMLASGMKVVNRTKQQGNVSPLLYHGAVTHH